MPTITYLHEPTDSIYFIDYSQDLQAETVVVGTIYRVDAVIRTKGGFETAAVEQVPSITDIAVIQANIDTIVPVLDAAVLDRDAKQIVLVDAQAALKTEELAFVPVELSYMNAIDALATANTALAGDNTNPTLISEVATAQSVVDTITPTFTAAQQSLAAAEDVVTTAAAEFGIAENLVDDLQLEHDTLLASTTITTEAVDLIPATNPEMVLKYIVRTEYNESVTIEDESLIFTDKDSAFLALATRTA